MNAAEPHSTEPNGALKPLLTQKPTLSPCFAISAAGTPCATAALNTRAPSMCTGTPFSAVSARSFAM